MIKKEMKKNDIAIYTAIFGAYDDLRTPPKEIKNCDFYCFTDNKSIKSDVWNIIYIESKFDDKTRDARKIKCLPHKVLVDYEYTLWTDANVIFKEIDVESLFRKFLKNNDIAIHSHQDRDCVYDEMVACVDRDIDFVPQMVSQVVGYMHEGYPDHNGLAETTVVFRRNTKSSQKVNEDWWNEIRTKSKRDQLSIDYVIWKNKVHYYSINKSVRGGKYFAVRDHNKNSYVERGKTLKVNQLQRELLKKDAIINELRHARCLGGRIIGKMSTVVDEIKHFINKAMFHLRNDGIINTGKRIKNFLIYGRGVIDMDKK